LLLGDGDCPGGDDRGEPQSESAGRLRARRQPQHDACLPPV
jgi:hypothetical protein